jgi:hypothetical protein
MALFYDKSYFIETFDHIPAYTLTTDETGYHASHIQQYVTGSMIDEIIKFINRGNVNGRLISYITKEKECFLGVKFETEEDFLFYKLKNGTRFY